MANEKTPTTPKAATKNLIKPPARFFRWEEPTITGKLLEPIDINQDDQYGQRTLVVMDVAQVTVPRKYAAPWKKVPVGATVTITKEGAGRDTDYILGWE